LRPFSCWDAHHNEAKLFVQFVNSALEGMGISFSDVAIQPGCSEKQSRTDGQANPTIATNP
jgi:hypothetical protein